MVRVLLVEDEGDDAAAVTSLLTEKTRLEFEVQHVQTLGAACDQLLLDSTDLVLLDLSLSDSSGLPSVTAILEAAGDVPVIVLTDPRDADLGLPAVRAGVQDYLVKGEFDSGLLERAIRLALERRNGHRERVRSTEELELLQRLTVGIARARTVDGALELVLGEICETTGWTTGESWIPDPVLGRLRQGPFCASDDEMIARFHAESDCCSFSPGEGPAGRAWASGEPVWIPDVSDSQDFCRGDLAREAALRMAVLVPVPTGSEVTAVLAFYHTEPRGEDQHLVSLVAAVAAQLGSLIERKRTEEALALSEERFRQVLRTSPVIVSNCDRDLRYTWIFNPHPRFRAEEMLGRRDEDLSPAERVAELVALKRAVLETGRRERRELRIQEDDQVHYYDATAEPLPGARGVSVVAVDVTERKRAELAERLLAAAGELLASSLDLNETLAALTRLLVPAWADWCVIDLLDESGELRAVKIAAARPDKEALLRTMLDRFPHDSIPSGHPVGRALSTGESSLIGEVTEETIRAIATNDEHERMLRLLAPRSLMIVPLLAHQHVFGAIILTCADSGFRFEPHDLGLLEELARRTALAIENARLYQKAQRALQARDEVLGVVAHDLRNPLGAITMYASILQQDLPRDDPRARSVSGVLKAADQMDRLIQDLLDVARTEAGQLHLRSAPVDVSQLVREACEMLGGLAAADGLQVEYVVHGTPPSIQADRHRVLRLLHNLISNAIKFTPRGGRVVVVAEETGGAVRFSVRDTGPGIHAEHLDRLFTRFWQAERNDRSGAGLGLTIAKEIAEAHGGQIWAESQLGEGSTFYFTMPAAASDTGAD